MVIKKTNKFEQKELHMRPTQNYREKYEAQFGLLGPLGVKFLYLVALNGILIQEMYMLTGEAVVASAARRRRAH